VIRSTYQRGPASGSHQGFPTLGCGGIQKSLSRGSPRRSGEASDRIVADVLQDGPNRNGSLFANVDRRGGGRGGKARVSAEGTKTQQRNQIEARSVGFDRRGSRLNHFRAAGSTGWVKAVSRPPRLGTAGDGAFPAACERLSRDNPPLLFRGCAMETRSSHARVRGRVAFLHGGLSRVPGGSEAA